METQVPTTKRRNFLATSKDLLKQVGEMSEHIFVKWELYKQDLEQLAIERSSILKFEKSETEKSLLRNLRVLVELECTNPGQGFEDIFRMKAELDTLYQERYRGAVVRTRTENILWENCLQRAMKEERGMP